MRARRLALLAGPCLAVLIFLPALGHEFVFDDRGAIQANPLLHDLRDLPRILIAPYWSTAGSAGGLYRPLTTLTFALDRLVARGLHPGWFHLVNLLLHGLATWLVVRLAGRILNGTAAPALAGLLFAVHPVHVEAVAGVVGRSEILAACGALASVLAHRRALESPPGRAGRWIAAAGGAGFMAMLAKESGVIAPILCLLSEIAFPASATPARARRLTLYGGHLLALAGYLAARLAVLGGLGLEAPIHPVDNPAAAAGPLDGRLTALAVLLRYAGLLIWPARLSADYSHAQIPVAGGLLDPAVLAGAALAAAVVIGGILLIRVRPAAGFSLLWIAVSASLTTNLIVFIGTLCAERLMYLPSVGLCLLVGWGVAACRGRWRTIAVGFAILLGAAGAARTLARIPDWKDDLALYGSAARVSPRSVRIRFNLGNAHLRRGDWSLAEENYRAALDIYPGFDDALMNLGMALLQQGRVPEAIEHLTAAVKRNPRETEARVNLASAYRAMGDPSRAEALLLEVLDENPRSAKAWNNLGSIALSRGEIERAVTCLRRAVNIDPGMAVFRVNLADALNAAGMADEADSHFEAAHRLDPSHPEVRRGRGEAALRRGEVETAERAFRAAAAGRPPSARAANFLGFLLARRGDLDGARTAYERAIRIDPSLYDAHNSLAMIYGERLGDTARAIDHLERSLRIEPGQPDAERIRRTLEELKARAGGGD